MIEHSNMMPWEVVESQSWSYPKYVLMWHFNIWFSGDLGSGTLMAGLNDLKGPF